MLMEPSPALSRAFSLVTQQEREFGGGHASDTSQEIAANIVFNANTTQNNSNSRGGFSNNRGGSSSSRDGLSGRSTNNGRNNKFCTKCHRTNHTIDTSFLIHGYPPAYKNNGNNTSRQNQPSVNTTDIVTSFAPANSTQEENKLQNTFSFSKDQYHALLALLQQSPNPSSSVNSVHNCLVNTPGLVCFSLRVG
ncbi:unnamed protein product [Cuscuta europaea]|uniref:Uncharacterized protein n=1 Tax=Cuscuta europaea TaxID=41803 RepID=A0A9P0ZQ44_CUSEU|nr:unnamed protein product [Cuscuta europaea]